MLPPPEPSVAPPRGSFLNELSRPLAFRAPAWHWAVTSEKLLVAQQVGILATLCKQKHDLLRECKVQPWPTRWRRSLCRWHAHVDRHSIVNSGRSESFLSIKFNGNWLCSCRHNSCFAVFRAPCCTRCSERPAVCIPCVLRCFARLAQMLAGRRTAIGTMKVLRPPRRTMDACSKMSLRQRVEGQGQAALSC
jgi:hypothetical protein